MNLPDSLIKALTRRKCSAVEDNGQFRLTGAVMRLPADVCTELLRLQVKGVPFAKAPVQSDGFPMRKEPFQRKPPEVPPANVDALLLPFGSLIEAAQQERLPKGVIQFSAWESSADINQAVRMAASVLRIEGIHSSPYVRALAAARIEQLQRMAAAVGFETVGD